MAECNERHKPRSQTTTNNAYTFASATCYKPPTDRTSQLQEHDRIQSAIMEHLSEE